MIKTRLAAALLIGLFTATSSPAASISYFLDQSDKLPDGTNYLQVTISDGLDGAIDFTVSTLQPLLDLAGKGFGITKFAFNAVDGIPLKVRRVDVSNLGRGWAKGPQQKMGDFGKYDMRLRITSSKTPRLDTISFSITGISFDELLSYVDLARNSSEGPSFFSARVDGLDLCGTSQPTAFRKSGKSASCKPTTAFFGGATAVPAPPALWLLGTAIAALGARRYQASRRAAA